MLYFCILQQITHLGDRSSIELQDINQGIKSGPRCRISFSERLEEKRAAEYDTLTKDTERN